MTSVYSDAVPVEATTTALKFSMSATDRWFHCPGSAWLSAVLRSPSSVYAQEGTAGHGVLETALGYPDSPREALERLIGSQWRVERDDPNAVYTVDRDMVEYALASRDAVLDFFGAISDKKISTEKFVEYKNRGLVSRGRMDISLVDDQFLAVVDYKYGQGVIVEAKNNLQLGAYLCAMRQRFGPRPWYYGGILQPRGRGAHPDRIKWWVASEGEIARFETLMVAAMDRARMYPVPYVSGDWCRWCPGKGICPAWAENAIQALLFKKAAPSQPNLWILEYADAIRSYLKQTEADAYALLESGGEVPGWVLSAEPGNRRWSDNAKEGLVVRAIESGWSKNDVVKIEEKIIGIGEAEKLGIDTKGLTEKRETVKLRKRENAKNRISGKDTLKGF